MRTACAALAVVLSLPVLAAASQCAPSDACEVTARVLSVRAGPTDDEGISILQVKMRILSVGRMVEKSRFSAPGTCADAYKKGQKVEINRLKSARKELKGSGNDSRQLEGYKPGAVLRGEIRYGCDERMSWYDFENVTVLRPAVPGPSRKGPASGRRGKVVLACGCGCCGGVEPVRQCLYHSRGDDPKKIIEEDQAASRNPACSMMGCSRGVEYVWCD